MSEAPLVCLDCHVIHAETLTETLFDLESWVGLACLAFVVPWWLTLGLQAERWATKLQCWFRQGTVAQAGNSPKAAEIWAESFASQGTNRVVLQVLSIQG